MKGLIRIAVCQIKCHPAIYSGQQMHLEEPFVPENRKHSLSYLSLKGFPVDDLQERCRERYINWQKERLRAILNHLKLVTPIPQVLVFPEGSIPYQCLDEIANYASLTGTTVFAGTHSLQKVREVETMYRRIGIKENSIHKIMKKTVDSTIAPIFTENRIHLTSKKIASPFETTDLSKIETPAQILAPFRVPISGKMVTILPLICAEALNFPKLRVKGDYLIVVIMSYEKDPSRFDAIIQTLSSNKKVVVYCNDGLYGGSSLSIPIDERSALWFFESNLHGCLSREDAILIADINLNHLGVEVGVSSPSRNFTLIKLASISYDKDVSSSGISKRMIEIKEMRDSVTRHQEIQRLLDGKTASELQKDRLRFLGKLAQNGRDSEEWWNTIGTDWIIDSFSLTQIEKELCKYCYERLADQLLERDSGKAGFEELRQFLRRTKEIYGEDIRASSIYTFPQAGPARFIINRDEDVESILSFLDNPNQKIAQISGLQQIGKTSTINKALSQFVSLRLNEVPVHETPSAEYLVLKLLPELSEKRNSREELISRINIENLSEALDRINILWVHNCERLMVSDNWRNNEIAMIVDTLIKAAKGLRVQIIFETRRELPLDFNDPSLFFRKRIYGMERHLQSHGVTYLDSQIRRIGFSPNEFAQRLKEKIVEKLGGHPVALALCADSIYEEGISKVLEHLERKKGFYLNFLRKLVEDINLTDEERTILRLLSVCRLPIPREAITASFDSAVAPFIRNLIHLCLLEVDTASHIRLPGIIANFFDIEEVSPEISTSFHRNCHESYKTLFDNAPSRIEFAIEADYHGGLGGLQTNLSGALVDSQVAVAKKYFDSQDYPAAKKIMDNVMRVKSTDDILRFCALVDAKCNAFESALEKAENYFQKHPSDTWLLSEIARAALSQRKDSVVDRLIHVAKSAGMEDTSILIISGRMLLRKNKLEHAKVEFDNALKKTTRNAWPFYYLGKVYMRLGQIDDAIDVLYKGETFVYDKEIKNENVIAAIRTQLGIAYLLDDNIDLAEPIINGLFAERKDDPEVMRAYAALGLKKEGIDKAHEAYRRLNEANIRNAYDRAQYHLFYGLFYLGLNDKGNASKEFSFAHQYDRNNVYTLMRLAKTYYDMANDSLIDGEEEIAEKYANDCAEITKKILEFDKDNKVAVDLQIGLYERFNIEVSTA